MRPSPSTVFLLVSACAVLQTHGQVSPPSAGTNQAVDATRARAAVFHGHRYAVYTDKLTWPDAKKACEDKGGHLVTFGDVDERDFVQRLQGVPDEGAWIGIVAENWQQRRLPKVKTLGSQTRFYELEGSDFVWVDGKRGLHLWKSSIIAELDAGGSQSLYVFITPKGENAKWDGDPDALRAYVCEWDK